MAANPCLLTSGIRLPSCNLFNPAGISNIYLMPAVNIDESKYEINLNGYGVINVISASTDWYEVEILPETSSAEQKLLKDEKTGAMFYEQIISFSLIRPTTLGQFFLTQLVNTNQIVAIVKLMNQSWWLYGKENYLTPFEPTISSGIAYGDFHGIRINLKGKEIFPAYAVNPNAFTVSTAKYNS